MDDYNNFHKALAKEKDKKAQARLRAFYKKYFKSYKVIDVDFKTGYAKYMQLAGVDKILYKQAGNKQIWIQEKVCSKNYPNVLFEYKKKSGALGWAICPNEKSKYIVYYMDGEILLFDTVELREWLTDNLERFKQKYLKQTDNFNLVIPKDIVYDSLDVKVYELADYWKNDD
jgi:hypothetical protein